jgi:hypothetical protein
MKKLFLFAIVVNALTLSSCGKKVDAHSDEVDFAIYEIQSFIHKHKCSYGQYDERRITECYVGRMRGCTPEDCKR